MLKKIILADKKSVKVVVSLIFFYLVIKRFDTLEKAIQYINETK